jgi:hypothetical protein
LREIHKRMLPLTQKHLFLFIPLLLSAYTHLWNPVGFPDFFYDEGVYIRRALHVSEGLGPQELTKYDHPYFGQLFLGFMFKIIGYPDSLNPKSGEVHSTEMLYLVPRVLMGLLAVLDTFLVYKIGDKKYNKKVGFVASLLFAVMPGTWLLRRILLDSILLPFLLSSIFFAISRDERRHQRDPIKGLRGINLKNNLLTMLSGVFLGLAIFTKIPAFAMIPLIAYLILTKGNYSNKRTTLKILGLWFIPVILIPAAWPIFAFSIDQFDDWKDGVFYQTKRNNGGLAMGMERYSRLDPVMLIMGLLGLAYAAIRKELFTVIGIVPFLLFLYFIGYVSYYHIVPVLPMFCISAAWLVVDAPVWITHKLRSPSLSKYTFGSIIIVVIISGIGIISTSMLLVLDASKAQIQAAVYTGRYLVDNMTLISNPIYSWVPLYVFNHSQTLESFWDIPEGKVQYDYVILLADRHMRSTMKKDLVNLWSLYNSTTLSTQFKSETTEYDTKKYPYTNLQAMREGASVDIRNGSHISIG